MSLRTTLKYVFVGLFEIKLTLLVLLKARQISFIWDIQGKMSDTQKPCQTSPGLNPPARNAWFYQFPKTNIDDDG